MAGPTVTLTFAGDSKSLEKTLGKVGNKTESLADRVDRNFGRVTAAGLAVGGAFEAFAQKQAPLNEGLGRVANSTGIATDELRDLVRETSNVTFPLEDVIGLMERGAQQGLESADALREYAEFWDTVGAATGENADQLAEAGVALRAVGIAAGEESQALDAFGYITENTSGTVGGFLKFLDRTGPQLREFGLSIDDAAAFLGIMETELGMSGRTARQEFRKAVNEADGDLNALFATLGLTGDQFAQYRDAVSDSSGTIEALSDNHGDTYTWLDKVKHAVNETLFAFGDYSDVISAAALTLMSLGPISKAVVGFFRLMGSHALINGARMAAGWLIGMGPIGWAIGIIGLLVGAFIWAWNNIDGFREGVISAMEWVGDKVQGVVDWIVDAWNWATDTLSTAASKISGFFSSIWDGLKSGAKAALNFAIDMVNKAISALNSPVNLLNNIPGVNVPTIPKIPRLHRGGVVPGTPGSEMLAVLQAGETVTPAGRTPPGGHGGGTEIMVRGGADSAVASLIMRLIRSGQIQLQGV